RSDRSGRCPSSLAKLQNSKEPQNVQELASVSIPVPGFIDLRLCSSRHADLRPATTIRQWAAVIVRWRSSEGASVAIDWTISRRSRDRGYRCRVAADGFLFRRHWWWRLENDGWRDQLGANH